MSEKKKPKTLADVFRERGVKVLHDRDGQTVVRVRAGALRKPPKK